MKDFKHEVDNHGHHRIVDTKTGVAGEWAGYQAIATLVRSRDNRKLIAVTDYHSGGLLIPEVVYVAIPAVDEKD